MSDLEKKCFQAVQEVDDLIQVIHSQKLIVMISEHLELSAQVQARQVRVDLLLDLHQEQIEELQSHLIATCSAFESLLSERTKTS